MQLKGKKQLPTTIRIFNLYKFNVCTLGKIIITSQNGTARSAMPAEGSGARGVVASKPLIDAVQQVLGEAIPGTGQHLLEANDCFEAQPWGEGSTAAVSRVLSKGCEVSACFTAR